MKMHVCCQLKYEYHAAQGQTTTTKAILDLHEALAPVNSGMQVIVMPRAEGIVKRRFAAIKPSDYGKLEKFAVRSWQNGSWNSGTLELWNIGTLEHWNSGTLELWISA